MISESGHELYSDARQIDGETQPAPPEAADFSLGLPGGPGEPADPGSSRCDSVSPKMDQIKQPSRGGVQGWVEKGSVDPWPGGGGQREAVNCLFGNGWHIVAGASNSSISCRAWALVGRAFQPFNEVSLQLAITAVFVTAPLGQQVQQFSHLAARLIAMSHQRVCDQEHAGVLLQEQNEAKRTKPGFSGASGRAWKWHLAIGGNEQMRWHTGDCFGSYLAGGPLPPTPPSCMLHPSHLISDNSEDVSTR
ncbi:hypothetical protein QBC41DRAFT_28589 [Cercophora samala]|uniref:Uncharacterized protein n=1 Tax=Cercophora samala TaxID=330535 RepID=A0AA39Z1M0_9PEZI|nr:hypothetical protein QBC41DRAFT_28589 [Cercophora samala]